MAFLPRWLLRVTRASLILSCLPVAGQVAAQPTSSEPIGVVTAVQGQATVARNSVAAPAALHFKDTVYLNDQITTRENSTVRLLLGGKGILVIREQSQLTLDESPTAEGGRRASVRMLSGKIGAAISRPLMRQGDEVEIRTPNAVAAVRGTVFIIEYIPPEGQAATSGPILLASAAPGPLLAQGVEGTGGTTNLFVLSGQVGLTPQGQSPLLVGALQTVSVSGAVGGPQASPIQTMTPAQANQAAQGLSAGKPLTGLSDGSMSAQTQQELATQLTNHCSSKPAGGAADSCSDFYTELRTRYCLGASRGSGTASCAESFQ